MAYTLDLWSTCWEMCLQNWLSHDLSYDSFIAIEFLIQDSKAFVDVVAEFTQLSKISDVSSISGHHSVWILNGDI